MTTRFDLQSHSTRSDGELSPTAVVNAGVKSGKSLLALTDHDTVAGVDEALEAGACAGVVVVPAVELSAVDGAHEELHVLGYAIDHRDSEFVAALADLRRDRERRVLAMAELLRAEGFVVDGQELLERRAAGSPLGRPQLARAVLGDPANAERLEREGIAGTRELFARHLVPGGRCYVPRSRPTVREAIELIHSVGGVAVWAHPFWDIDSGEEVVRTLRRFAAMGLDGVEAFYPTHRPEQAELLCRQAAELDILTTGSSDFHGPNHELFSSFSAFDVYGHECRLGPLADYAPSRAANAGEA